MRTQELRYKRPWMYPKQLEIFECKSRYTLCEATTKAGKTAMCLLWIFEKAIMEGKSGYNYWWVAPTFGTAGIAFNRLKRMLIKGGLPRNTFQVMEGAHTIKLSNGVTIFFKSAMEPNNLFGEDVHSCIIDEASRVKEESWHAIRSTLTATQGQIKMIGNVVNKHNWFYKFCRSNNPNATYFKLTAEDAIEGFASNPLITKGVITTKELEDARNTLPHHVFRALYFAEAGESGMNPFGIDYINACTIQVEGVDKQTFSYHNDKKVICYGIDLARGKTENADFTSVIGLTEDLEVTFDIFKGPWKQQLSRIKNIIGNTPTFIELNSIGSTMFELLIDDTEQLEGFNTTNKSKKELVEKDLTPFILQKRLRIPEGIITDELKDYECQILENGNHTYNSLKGHDDTVISLALCLRKYKFIMGESDVGTYDFCVFDVKNPTQNTINNTNNTVWTKVGSPALGY